MNPGRSPETCRCCCNWGRDHTTDYTFMQEAELNVLYGHAPCNSLDTKYIQSSMQKNVHNQMTVQHMTEVQGTSSYVVNYKQWKKLYGKVHLSYKITMLHCKTYTQRNVQFKHRKCIEEVFSCHMLLWAMLGIWSRRSTVLFLHAWLKSICSLLSYARDTFSSDTYQPNNNIPLELHNLVLTLGASGFPHRPGLPLHGASSFCHGAMADVSHVAFIKSN